MSINDLLNTDVETIGARLLDAVRWWLGEMRSLFGPLLIDRQKAPQFFAERHPDQRFSVRDAAGLPVPGDGLGRPVALVLGADAALVRLTPAPRVPERDIVRTVRLDLDRLTPFPPETAYQDISLIKTSEEGRPLVRLAAAPRARADAELTAALQAGLHVTAVVVEAPDGALIDFLPAMQSGERGGMRGWWIWGLVAALVIANVGFAIWRDSHDLTALQAAVAAQQPVVDRIKALRQRAEEDRSEALDRMRARDRGDPLRILDTLSQVLWQDAEISRLTWDGATVHLTGTRRSGGADVLEALKADPVFTNVRNANAEHLVDDGSVDVLADARPVAAKP